MDMGLTARRVRLTAEVLGFRHIEARQGHGVPRSGRRPLTRGRGPPENQHRGGPTEMGPPVDYRGPTNRAAAAAQPREPQSPEPGSPRTPEPRYIDTPSPGEIHVVPDGAPFVFFPFLPSSHPLRPEDVVSLYDAPALYDGDGIMVRKRCAENDLLAHQPAFVYPGRGSCRNRQGAGEHLKFLPHEKPGGFRPVDASEFGLPGSTSLRRNPP